MDEDLRYAELYSLAKNLLLAEKNARKKRNKYFEAKAPSRKAVTTLYAKKEMANEWFGKCELAFEKYINRKIFNGKFSLSYTPMEQNNEQNY